MIAFAQIYCHFIWRIENNSKKMNQLTRDLVKKFILDSQEKFAYECIAISVLEDHIHFLAKILPGVAPGDLVVRLKQELYDYLIKQMAMTSPPRWDEGYGIVSVSKSHLDIVKEYINNQNKRHRENKINKTLERVRE
ncbi:hypothetical protein DRQ33_06460 [bacterium]|nr:MAG: hypothetical protein DRQ33_06460 [bacterium]